MFALLGGVGPTTKSRHHSRRRALLGGEARDHQHGKASQWRPLRPKESPVPVEVRAAAGLLGGCGSSKERCYPESGYWPGHSDTKPPCGAKRRNTFAERSRRWGRHPMIASPCSAGRAPTGWDEDDLGTCLRFLCREQQPARMGAISGWSRQSHHSPTWYYAGKFGVCGQCSGVSSPAQRLLRGVVLEGSRMGPRGALIGVGTRSILARQRLLFFFAARCASGSVVRRHAAAQVQGLCERWGESSGGVRLGRRTVGMVAPRPSGPERGGFGQARGHQSRGIGKVGRRGAEAAVAARPAAADWRRAGGRDPAAPSAGARCKASWCDSAAPTAAVRLPRQCGGCFGRPGHL